MIVSRASSIREARLRWHVLDELVAIGLVSASDPAIAARRQLLRAAIAWDEAAGSKAPTLNRPRNSRGSGRRWLARLFAGGRK